MKDAILNELVPQVKRNCIISDARYWGHYSMCGLLLRLRELYRFEQGIPMGQPLGDKTVAEWIGKMESEWDRLKEEEFIPLIISGEEFGPFHVDSINRLLNLHGLVYGAGLGMYMKPVFFLADLERLDVRTDHVIYMAGKEYARDLSIHPAMLQERKVFSRRYPMEVLIHQKYEEFRAAKTQGTLWRAFSAYGVNDHMSQGDFSRIVDEEIRASVYHELGELAESDRLGTAWNEMLAGLTDKRAAVFARGVKDTLADTTDSGFFDYVIRGRRAGTLAFYFSFMDGYRRTLTCDLRAAYSSNPGDGNWTELEVARKRTYDKAKVIADELLRTAAGSKRGAVLEIIYKYLNGVCGSGQAD